ncbi:MAG: hypothetical protein IKM24_10100 [Clostridia bacterium]|nr:hypothetical protein [Clostridia bacterium]
MYKFRSCGLIVCAFGIGLLAGCCFPEKLILVVISLLLVGTGFCVSRC